jgi:hypothetical protein
MSEQIWYVFQQGQQMGPFSSEQMQQLVSNKIIAQDAYLFKVGWKDWRPVEETHQELGLGSAKPAEAARVQGAPRASIKGRVMVHNNGQLQVGGGVNISSTGIFVETPEQVFTVGERLKLSVKCDGLAKPFNVMAQVIRFNSDPRWPVGYGLKFEDLAPSVKMEIQAIIDGQNGGLIRNKAG